MTTTGARKFLLKILLLIVLPGFMLDLAYRLRPDRFHWYAQVARELSDDETNVFVVGSSRTLLAIDADRATQDLRRAGIAHARVYNLGGPYSTQMEHLLGLRDLAEDRPAALHGSLWLFETLDGLPERRATRADSWLNPDHKELLLNVMRARDLREFWASRGLPAFDKAYLATALFSRLGRSFLDSRTRLIMLGERGADRWLRALFPLRADEPAEARDSGLAKGTPVRTDEAGIQFARQLALQEAAEMRAEPQLPYDDWEHQILFEWVETVKRAGGRPFFFDVPVSAVQAAAVLTPMRREDARRLAGLAADWGVRELPLRLSYTDEDFPDLIHVRESRRGEFTDALTRELAAALHGVSVF